MSETQERIAAIKRRLETIQVTEDFDDVTVGHLIFHDLPWCLEEIKILQDYIKGLTE